MLELGDSVGTLSYNGDCQSSRQDRLNGNHIIEVFLNRKECLFFAEVVCYHFTSFVPFICVRA